MKKMIFTMLMVAFSAVVGSAEGKRDELYGINGPGMTGYDMMGGYCTSLTGAGWILKR